MNKVYKIVWNAARNCYVVGSEFIGSFNTGGGGGIKENI
ncbi:MAG: ESPR domain-containing protein [Megasphaera cerevisiae]|nr:ESPR domain-containing protein [Megasphaera cerevisiae]